MHLFVLYLEALSLPVYSSLIRQQVCQVWGIESCMAYISLILTPAVFAIFDHMPEMRYVQKGVHYFEFCSRKVSAEWEPLWMLCDLVLSFPQHTVSESPTLFFLYSVQSSVSLSAVLLIPPHPGEDMGCTQALSIPDDRPTHWHVLFVPSVHFQMMRDRNHVETLQFSFQSFHQSFAHSRYSVSLITILTI